MWALIILKTKKMAKISLKNQKIFIDLMKSELIKIKAIPFISDSLQFDLKTKYGIYWVRVDYDQNICYSVFGRFVNPELAPLDFDGINYFSGKWNHHLGPEGNPKIKAQIIIDRIKYLLN